MAQPIPLAPATIVNVTFAALYSNTQFATLQYGIGSSTDFYHTLSFGVLNSGINIGYSTSQSGSYTGSVTGVESAAIQMLYYSNAYDDCPPGGGSGTFNVVDAGIGEKVPYNGYYANKISEYITNASALYTTDLPHTFTFGACPGTWTYGYSETGSYTWGLSVGSPFGILFGAWGNIISIDETVSTTTEKTNDVSISVTIPPGYGDVQFMAYCPGPPGTTFNPLQSSVGTGGFELHIWDMSADG
jgi:hypothetical protein